MNFGEIIHSYTRAQAIADGALVDATKLGQEAGFRYPLALTRAVWEDCVAWAEADDRRKGTIQDETGRLWDVIWMASRAARRAAGSDRVEYQIVRVPRAGRARAPRPVQLVMVIGPGDSGEGVITIMQPDED